MILVDEKQHREYIKVLSQIVKLVKKEDIVSKMIETEEPNRVIQVLSEGT
jgi:mannitol/fructose-specific phosphotransferase system IIA component (Ntr-type)